MIVSARVARFGVRNTDGDFILLLAVWNETLGWTDNSELDKLGLDAAVVQTHGVSATVPMDEPLAQVGGHFDVDVEVAHNIRVEWFRAQRYYTFSVPVWSDTSAERRSENA